jgi:hypothetical protein
VELWVWIAVFIVAWLLEALASAAKKNRQRQQPRPPLREPPRAAPRVPPRVDTPPPPAQARRAPPRRAREPFVIRQPEGTLEGVSAEQDVAPPEAESTEPTHLRATGKYGPAAPGEIGAPESARRRPRLDLRRGSLRQAVIWREVLGQPKSEQW